MHPMYDRLIEHSGQSDKLFDYLNPYPHHPEIVVWALFYLQVFFYLQVVLLVFFSVLAYYIS
jgi:hypothetical protein